MQSNARGLNRSESTKRPQPSPRPFLPFFGFLPLLLAAILPSSQASDANLTASLANGKIQLSWPADFSHYFLLQASEPVPIAWSELVVPTITDSDSTVHVTLDPTNSARFFQLTSGETLFDGSSLDAFRR